jgi:Fe-S-cluster containining protein
MPQELQTFLTLIQAIDAIAADFGQYGPQPDLFRKIGPLILGNNFKSGILNGFERAWIRLSSDHPFELVDDPEFGFYLIHVLEISEKDAIIMAQICALVFQTPTRPGVFEGESGVWIENQMNGFVCKKCGNCCTQLENVCVREDKYLWESLGYGSILSWVKEEQLNDGEIQYRIWIDPQTGKPAESCPFLAQQPGKKTFFCTIQAVKPLVCREYPFTKKHAQHTGCMGFDVIHPDNNRYNF